ncbi:MAG: hypothetical protein LKF96_09615 [Treponema sp.]|nr:hypothetical protein [Treponema sp.]
MKSEISAYNENAFEDIKHINENGQEYWLARKLRRILCDISGISGIDGNGKEK